MSYSKPVVKRAKTMDQESTLTRTVSIPAEEFQTVVEASVPLTSSLPESTMKETRPLHPRGHKVRNLSDVWANMDKQTYLHLTDTLTLGDVWVQPKSVEPTKYDNTTVEFLEIVDAPHIKSRITKSKISIDDLLHKIENIGDILKDYTEKLIFSFADIKSYRKVQLNLEKNNICYSEWTDSQMREFASRLSCLNHKWNFRLATCGEKIDLSEYGIEHSHCVDENLIIRFSYKDKILMDFLGVEICRMEGSLFDSPIVPSDAILLTSSQYAIKKKSNRDTGQRIACGCITSKDIGEYNTCPHLCEYCYANSSKETAVKNWKQHKQNEFGETIKGE